MPSVVGKGIGLGSNFSPRYQKFLDDRQEFDTKADMKDFPETSLVDGLMTFCKEDNKHYVFNSSNAASTETGKWVEFTADVQYLSDDDLDLQIADLLND